MKSKALMNIARLSNSLLAILVLLHGLLCFINVAYAEPIKVGMTLPLTGKLGGYGAAFRNGVELFQEEDAESQKQVTFIFDDSQYDGTKVASAVRKLAAVDKVDLLYVWGVTPSQVAAPIAQQSGVPLLAMTTDPVSKGRPGVASLQLPLEALQSAISHFVSDHNFKTTGIIVSDFGAATRLTELLKPHLPGLAYYEVVPTDSLDFRTLAARIRSKPVDAIILMVLPEQTLPLARQLAAQKVRAHVIGGDMLADEYLREELTAFMGEASYVYGEVDADFRKRYQARFGDTSHVYEAAAGYSAGLMIAEVARRSLNAKPVELMPLLVGPQYQTPIGEIRFQSLADQGIAAMLKARVYSERAYKLDPVQPQ
jgi:ABC-type branched-subunit amino acid transport system substrate-binding protein